MIYLDNAATSCPKPPSVARAVADAIGSFGGAGRGVHAAALAADEALFEARDAVSRLLGGPGADRVSLAANATAALNIAIAGLLPSGGKAVTTAASHNSVLRPLFKARDERGCAVEVVPHAADGSLDYAALERAVHGADLAVVTHASNLAGDIYDVRRIARAAHAAGALVVLDVAQTAGSVPVDMAALGADVLCFTGHKGLLGPQGTGGLIVAAGVEVPPLLEGGSGMRSFDERHPHIMPEALEAGTPNAHGAAGLAAGIAYLEERGVDDVATCEAELATRFRIGIEDVEGVRVLGGAPDAGRCGIVPFNVGSLDSALVAAELAQGWDICVRAGAHCAPLMHRALGTERQGAVRASFGAFNTVDEVDVAIAAVAAVAAKTREA